jgi:predicted HAD superfamily Cof-like phosphohydrolase
MMMTPEEVKAEEQRERDLTDYGTMHLAVSEFQRKMGFPTRELPADNLPLKILLKRIRLIQEEFFELTKAVDENNVLEMLDAYGDLLYVVIGFGSTLGLPTQRIFDEVHRSNMTKAGMNEHMKGGKGEGFEPPNLESVLQDFVNRRT